ncbi:STING domain-containing protein [Variovorax sp.]|uniref:STING domain-containing protein n=1 Tax=Variovorax sp. TaxID=1871043 RepID=UPI002D45A792|nr:STING domain-containing protein [Variovorax sp.]HYP86147.1 STING domain-containing protein [Variovorax sp.]
MTASADYRTYVRLVYRRYRVRGLVAGLFAALAGILTLYEAALAPGDTGSWIKVSTLLSAIFAVLAAVWSSMKSEIEGKYTLALALAHGYYQNLVLRVLADPDARLIVYRPAQLEALEPAAVQATCRQLADQGASMEEVPVPGADGARTVLRVSKPDGGAAYLDFPRTLRTLSSLLDYRDREYKAATGSFFTPEHRALVTKRLIDEFFEELRKMAALEKQQDRMVFTDSISKQL